MKDYPRRGVVALGLLLGLWGLRWGLPDRARLDRVLAPGSDGPALHEALAQSWVKLHERLGPNLMNNPESYATFTGVERVKAGWTEPPELMLNSLRSFYVRSSYEDEQSALLALSRMRPRQLNFNPHLFTYGGAYLYPLGAWEAAGAAVGAVELHSSLMPYLADPAKMGGLYYWGRVLSALAFVGCGLLLLRIGRSSLGAGTGPLAAVFFLLSPAAIVHGHSLKNHIVWTFFALLTLDRCQAVLKRGSARDYAWAGAAAGLTVGAFLMGWPATLFVAVAAAIRLRRGERPAAEELRGVGIAAACAIAAFFLSNPYWALSLREAAQEMKALSGNSHFDWRSPLLFLAGSMRRSVTTPVLLLILAGAAHAARRGRRDPELLLVLGAFLAGLTFAWAAPDVASAFGVRYGLGWVAVGMLLAARAAADAWASAGARLRPAAAAVLAALVLHLAATGATYAENFRLDEGAGSTHRLSGAWIEAHVPAGASIGMLRLPQPSNAPYFHYHRYDLRFIEPRLFGALPVPQLPEYLAVTVPIHDDRPDMQPNLSRYERVAAFDRFRLVPWIAVDPASSTANPLIEIYRLKS
jgi:hypothetical protein